MWFLEQERVAFLPERAADPGSIQAITRQTECLI